MISLIVHEQAGLDHKQCDSIPLINIYVTYSSYIVLGLTEDSSWQMLILDNIKPSMLLYSY